MLRIRLGLINGAVEQVNGPFVSPIPTLWQSQLVEGILGDVNNATVAVIGAGGARATAFALARAKATVRNRSPERAERLCNEINAQIEQLSPDRRMLQMGNLSQLVCQS